MLLVIFPLHNVNSLSTTPTSPHAITNALIEYLSQPIRKALVMNDPPGGRLLMI